MEPDSTLEHRLLTLCNRPLVNPFNVLSQIIKSKQMVATKIRSGRYLKNSVPSFPQKTIYKGTMKEEVFSNAASAKSLAQQKFLDLIGDASFGILGREDAVQALEYLDSQESQPESQYGSQNLQQKESPLPWPSETQDDGSMELKEETEKADMPGEEHSSIEPSMEENEDSIPVEPMPEVTV
jgi:hypothetical protein